MKKFAKIAVLTTAVLIVLSLSACGMFYIPNYSVNYYDGETLVYSQNVRQASSLTPPKLDDKNGYFVTGWKDELGVSLSSDYPLKKEGNSFYAVWSPKTYSITYELDGGENHPDNPVSYDVTSTLSFFEPTKQGFEFLGWTTSSQVTPNKEFTIENGSFGDIVLYANWADENLNYLYFDTNGGSQVPMVSTEFGSFDLSQKSTYRLGYEFNGWYLDADFNTAIDGVLNLTERVTTVYAKWQIITYSITCAEEGFIKIDFNVETDTFTVPTLQKEGYEFLGYVYDGKETPIKNLEIKKGTARNYSLTAVFEVKKYTVSFETFGGEVIEDKQFDFGADITGLETPTKTDCEFIGWYLDEELTVPLGALTMPSKNITLYAKWYSDNAYTLSYSSQGASCKFDFNRASGTEVLCGDLVEISATPYANGGVFKYWLKGSDIYSYDNHLSFEMPNSSLSLVAYYSTIRTITFDKSSVDNLVVYNGLKTLTKIDGINLKTTDYSIDTKAINNSFLTKLGVGFYPIILTFEDTTEYALIEVTYLENELSNLDIDYDSKYPNVCILFEGEGSFEYSIDGSAFISCNSGDIIPSYDKSVEHVVTLRQVDNVENFLSVAKGGYNNESKPYYESSFTYGGNTYDLVIDNVLELDAFTHYFAFVYAPLNRSGSTTLYPGGVASMRYYADDSFKQELSSNIQEYVTKVFNVTGVPYAPSYSYTNLAGASGNVGKLEIYFTTESPSEILSSQEKTSKIQTQNLLKNSSRDNNFDNFKINGFEKTQEIRTLYELETLSYGVKPIFTNATTQAQEVYNKALEILRTYVDDSMNDYEKAKAIFDYLALNVTYDDAVAQESTISTKGIGKYRCFTSYGALVDNIAVCDGISSAYAILCKIEGIDCVEVTGLGNGGGHAWNKVNIYGKWYGVDTTWSAISTDEGDYVSHRNFLVDENALIGSGHAENGYYEGEDIYSRYLSNIAVDSLNYYSINFISGKDDFTATSSSDFRTIISYAIEEGASAIEVYVNSQTSLSQMINSAEIGLHVSISYYTLGNDNYLVIIE